MRLSVEQRDRLAAPTVAVYWGMLLLGLILYSAVRSSEPFVVVPIWIGALGGTVLGQGLALRDYRLWVTAFVIIGIAVNGTALAPVGVDAMHFWLAFVPAALCGALSLGDRAPLAAFWFPAVIWMLSILDRSDGQAIPGGVSAMLLGVLALMFVAFLYVRETRRIGLWRAVGPQPLARPKPGTVLREAPGSQLGRACWGVVLAAITFALTAWVAPQLWQLETFGGTPARIASSEPSPGEGPPCCPTEDEIDMTRSRVREYFDLGRGHDRRGHRRHLHRDACVPCNADGIPYDQRIGDGVPVVGVAGGGGDGPGGYGTGGRPTLIAPAEVPTPQPPVLAELPYRYDPRPPSPPQVLEVRPLPPPPPRHVETGVVRGPAAAVPARTPHPEPQVLPEPPPQVAPEPPKPTPRPAMQPRAPYRAQLPAPSDAGGTLLRWIVLLITAALASQVLRFALRPLRRLVAVRHLRRPFWRETVDQRVSNSWQLVLVGLRDAGWRTTSSEAPREFARRVAIDGVEPCAQILERARHGIGIDADDLSQMGSSAETAYRSARRPLGMMARLVAWLRWPLT